MGLFGRFGESRAEIWRKLSAELGGSYSPRAWLKRDRVQVVHRNWTITLDPFVVHAGKSNIPFTRFRAPFLNTDAFRLKVYRANVFSTVGSWFGAQDVQVGEPEFDRDFVVKSTDEGKARAFFADRLICRLLQQQKRVQMTVQDHEGWFGPKFPADTDELRVMVRGHLKDMERLRSLFALFATALDRLCAIGAASERPPALKL